MEQIVLEHVRKQFAVPVRQEGLLSAVRSLLRREYRTVCALDDISFVVDAGELVGYIGPNGAGKSTTIKVLSGILVPDSGQCRIMGRVPWRQRIAHVQQIGVVFGQRSQLWWDVPVIDSFVLLRDMYQVAPSDYRRVLATLVERLDLSSLLSVPARQLSLGQRMRCELAASLLHRPKILFLDEPTIGLDAVSKLAVREIVREISHEQGVTVILTTHDMDDVEALCTRILLIGFGRILFDGTLAALRQRFLPRKHMHVDFGSRWDGQLNLPGVEIQQCGAYSVDLTFHSNVTTAGAILTALQQ
jgi:ABC-2 type transport system ATP-binding protein